ncbi:MAG: PEP-CTERM sorting domain-containing protein [Candidatus Pacebacteria bacterium]|nr:PEP-CTERM sorting domain-containing protein [Candidatus Paceibacterota bacterium]
MKQALVSWVAVALTGWFALAGEAAVINVDFNAEYEGSETTTYSGQGAFSDPGNNYWNGVDVSVGTEVVVANPLYSDGVTSSDINITVPAIGDFFSWAGAFSPNALMDDWGKTSFLYNSETMTIDNLELNQRYALYLYGAVFNTEGSKFTINGVSQLCAALTAGETDITQPGAEGNAYVVFWPVYPDATGQIAVTWGRNNESVFFAAPFNGFQIAEVPEPSVGILAGLFALAWIWRRKPNGATAGTA